MLLCHSAPGLMLLSCSPLQVGQFFKSAMVWETWQHGYVLGQVVPHS